MIYFNHGIITSSFRWAATSKGIKMAPILNWGDVIDVIN